MSESLDVFVKISTQIGELNASIKSVLSILAQHEQRLSRLEDNADFTRLPLKDQTIQLLVKALIVSGVSIASLCGAGTFLAKVLDIL